MKFTNPSLGDIAFYTWSGSVPNPNDDGSVTTVIITHNLNRLPKKIDVKVQQANGKWTLPDYFDCTYFEDSYGWKSHGVFPKEISPSGLIIDFGNFGSYLDFSVSVSNPFPAVVKLYD